MERYHGNSGLAVLVGFIGVAFFAIAIWVTSQVAPELARANLLTLAEGIFLFFTFLGMGLLCLFAADSLGASYRLDDRGITRRSFLRETTIDWSDLDCFDERFSAETGTQYRYNLYAVGGRRISIATSCVADSDRLRDRLEPHLVPLRERAAPVLAKSGRTWHPDRTTGLVVLGFIAPLFLIAGLHALLGLPGLARDGKTIAPVLGVLFAAAALLLAVLGVELIARVLTVSSSGIAVRSLFLDRKISFGSVDSVTLRMDIDAPRYERAKIRGDGRSITIYSNMPGYHDVIDLVRSRSHVEPVRAGAAGRRKTGSPRGALEWVTDVIGPVLMFAGFTIVLTGGWQLFSARTAAGDRPAAALIRIGSALLLASVGLAIIAHHRRPSAKTKVPEL
jgi:TRAP-type C4-dicarboxylate transport system permease small subunit